MSQRMAVWMRFLEYDDELVSRLQDLINSPAPKGRQKEQVVQDFLENYSELIPTPNLLNHHLQFNSIVSKYPLSTALITDYIYLTKSSGLWKATLVELESPDKAIFTGDMKRAVPTAEFTSALAQVMSWKSYVNDHKAELLQRLEPLLSPPAMRRNPVAFEYQLIIGRSRNKNVSPDRLKYLENVRQGQCIDVITYDTLIGIYQSGQRYRKNVLRAAGNRFTFKSMLPNLPHVLAYLGPDQLELSAEQEAVLIHQGYEISKWKAGEALSTNGKLAASSGRPFTIAALRDGG